MASADNLAFLAQIPYHTNSMEERNERASALGTTYTCCDTVDTQPVRLNFSSILNRVSLIDQGFHLVLYSTIHFNFPSLGLETIGISMAISARKKECWQETKQVRTISFDIHPTNNLATAVTPHGIELNVLAPSASESSSFSSLFCLIIIISNFENKSESYVLLFTI
jgi:hypothetical protein